MSDSIQKINLIDIDLSRGTIHRSWCGYAIGMKDNNGDAFGIRVFRNKEPVDLTGISAQGFFRNSVGTNIAITSGNTVSGNTAYVVLPQACYDYDGPFTLAIKLIGGGVTGTMRIIDGRVDNTNTSGAVAPTGTVPTYQEVLSVFEQMQDALEDYDDVVATQNAQISDLKSAFDSLDGAARASGIIESIDWPASGDGKSIDASGVESSTAGFHASGFIPITPGDYIYTRTATGMSAGGTARIHGYLNNQAWSAQLASGSIGNGERVIQFTVPNSIAYIRISVPSTGTYTETLTKAESLVSTVKNLVNEVNDLNDELDDTDSVARLYPFDRAISDQITRPGYPSQILYSKAKAGIKYLLIETSSNDTFYVTEFFAYHDSQHYSILTIRNESGTIIFQYTHSRSSSSDMPTEELHLTASDNESKMDITIDWSKVNANAWYGVGYIFPVGEYCIKREIDNTLISTVYGDRVASWNIYDGSWGLSNKNPVTGTSTSYMVYSPAIPVTAGKKYSIGIVDNPLPDKVVVLSMRYYTSEGETIGSAFTLYRLGGKVIFAEVPEAAAKVVIFFNTNNGSVSITPQEIYNAGFKVIFAERLVNFNIRDNYGAYDLNGDEWIPSRAIDRGMILPRTETITVGASGCMYTNLRKALDDINAYGGGSEYTQFEVHIKDGTYDIRSYYTSEERAASGFWGLFVPNYVTLIGDGGKENVIIKWDGSSDNYSDTISTLNIRNRASLKGITVIGNNIRYAVHDDFATSETIENIRYVEDCIFIGENLHRSVVYGSGSGTYGGAKWHFKDCIFKGSNHIPFMQHNVPDNAVSSYITFENCRFIGAKNFEIQFASYNSGVTALNYASLYGCKFATEADTLGKIYLNEAAGQGIKYKVSGYANEFDSVWINNTDSVDYSGYIDLI